MAGRAFCEEGPISEPVLEDLKRLLWGQDIKHEVFRRWTQGFEFSEDEDSALVQFDGGPCAVIAPVQAFLLKNLLFRETTPTPEWTHISKNARDHLLSQTLADQLCHVSADHTITLVTHDKSQASTADEAQMEGERVVGEESSQAEEGEEGTSSPKKQCFSHEEFHSHLRCRKCSSIDELENQLQGLLPTFSNQYGVLLFLYSVVLTRGIDQIKNEIEDPGEPLIDGIHGHGSQSLINLLITGRAVSNVWDKDKELAGLKLHGIPKQSTIGFLTLLEHLRYCEVGWYLKNPEYPIWLLGSETHLTVLFSLDRNLVLKETPEAAARRVFSDFDSDSCGFISADLLGDLLGALDLVSEPEYVKIMRDKIDPEQLGIITLNGFMEEFFPSDPQPDAAQTFTIHHYNGLQRSCPDNKVSYVSGTATLMEFPELQILTDSSPIKTCLMTKWPTIELKWHNDIIPSLN